MPCPFFYWLSNATLKFLLLLFFFQIGEVGENVDSKVRGLNEDENVDFEITLIMSHKSLKHTLNVTLVLHLQIFAQSKQIWEQRMKISKFVPKNVIDLEDESVRNDSPMSKLKVEIIIDSDSDEEEKDGDERSSAFSRNSVLNRCHKETSAKNEEVR